MNMKDFVSPKLLEAVNKCKEVTDYTDVEKMEDDGKPMPIEFRKYDSEILQKDDEVKLVHQIITQVTEDMENFIFKTIQPWCEEQVERKVSKKDLENALKRYYYKQDTINVLKEVAKYIKCYIIMPDQEEQKLLSFIDKKIRELPNNE